MISNRFPIYTSRDPAICTLCGNRARSEHERQSQRDLLGHEPEFPLQLRDPHFVLPRNGDRICLSIPGNRNIRCYVEDMEWQYAELNQKIDTSIVAKVKILQED